MRYTFFQNLVRNAKWYCVGAERHSVTALSSFTPEWKSFRFDSDPVYCYSSLSVYIGSQTFFMKLMKLCKISRNRLRPHSHDTGFTLYRITTLPDRPSVHTALVGTDTLRIFFVEWNRSAMEVVHIGSLTIPHRFLTHVDLWIRYETNPMRNESGTPGIGPKCISYIGRVLETVLVQTDAHNFEKNFSPVVPPGT